MYNFMCVFTQQSGPTTCSHSVQLFMPTLNVACCTAAGVGSVLSAHLNTHTHTHTLAHTHTHTHTPGNPTSPASLWTCVISSVGFRTTFQSPPTDNNQFIIKFAKDVILLNTSSTVRLSRGDPHSWAHKHFQESQ